MRQMEKRKEKIVHSKSNNLMKYFLLCFSYFLLNQVVVVELLFYKLGDK